jgi:dihydroorotate dehydrogenase (fumarate)
MSDYNVTFAGLPLESPMIIESSTDRMDTDVAQQCREAGVGGVLFPVLDENRLNRVHNDSELTEHNRDDRGNRDSQRILHRMNTDEYLSALEGAAKELDIPVIGSLQCHRRGQWFPLAQQMKEAGAAAIEIRPYRQEIHRSVRSDQVEKSILRTTAYISDRLESPLIVRIPAFMHGIQTFVQALGEAGAAAVLVEPPDMVHAVDVESLSITDSGVDRTAAHAAFITALSTCRVLYRRVNTHIALKIPDSAASSLVMALMGGATVTTIPVDGTDGAGSSQLVRRYLTYLKKWMTTHSMGNLFDFRGIVSESRLHSSLEN